MPYDSLPAWCSRTLLTALLLFLAPCAPSK